VPAVFRAAGTTETAMRGDEIAGAAASSANRSAALPGPVDPATRCGRFASGSALTAGTRKPPGPESRTASKSTARGDARKAKRGPGMALAVNGRVSMCVAAQTATKLPCCRGYP
jgi:hypothetical protein